MSNDYQAFACHDDWLYSRHPELATIPAQLQNWLFDSGSLTTKLIDYSNQQFRVNVLSEQWQKPLRHEQRKLRLSTYQVALIREVELICNEQVVVYARSIIPLGRAGKKLQNLGAQPLGHLLFKRGGMRIQQREIAQIKQPDGSIIYARRTPFLYSKQEILISEFFINSSYLIKS